MKLLIVDDEIKLAETLAERLELRGFVTKAVYDGQSAFDQLETERFDGIILDLRLPDIDGMEILEKVMLLYDHLKVVILSGHASSNDFERCFELGAVACFQKPANIKNLVDAIRNKDEKVF